MQTQKPHGSTSPSWILQSFGTNHSVLEEGAYSSPDQMYGTVQAQAPLSTYLRVA